MSTRVVGLDRQEFYVQIKQRSARLSHFIQEFFEILKNSKEKMILFPFSFHKVECLDTRCQICSYLLLPMMYINIFIPLN